MPNIEHYVSIAEGPPKNFVSKLVQCVRPADAALLPATPSSQ
jgi:hypothetical protein